VHVKSTDSVDEFRKSWEQLSAQAHEKGLVGGGYDRPLAELLDATRETGLRRFHPFIAMNLLCFARSSWPFQDIQPAVIEFFPEGNYNVRSEGPYATDRKGLIVLETIDPAAAVAAVMRVLGN
jgi:hypothetical protein